VCRLLAIAAESPVRFHTCLCQAPRSLASLSREHADGWGAGVYTSDTGWVVERRTACAASDQRFSSIATELVGQMLLAHVRQRTVGAVSLSNTHPFQRNRWLFAHNGTINDMAFLRARTSAERLREREGDTDSELLFAHLLTRLDAAGLTDEPADERTDGVVATVVRELSERTAVGSFNFLLANGDVLYCNRFGRSLYLLERPASVECARTLLVASEPMTDEAWRPLSDGTLVRCDRRRELDVSYLWEVDCDEELPFTD